MSLKEEGEMIIFRTLDGKPLPDIERTLTIVEMSDEERQRNLAAGAARGRNIDWLGTQWPNLLPQVLGKYVAVAEQEAFIAPTSEEAWAWIRTHHPDALGSLVQRVTSNLGPKNYAIRG